MGMSDEERIQAIYDCISDISELTSDTARFAHDFSHKEVCDALIQKSRLLWHASLKVVPPGNISQPVTSESLSPWAVAIRHHFYKGVQVADILSAGQHESAAQLGEFDPVDFLAICNILSPRRAFIVDLYERCGSLLHVLRRYDDDFRHRFSELEGVADDCLGTCYMALRRDSTFAIAYCLRQIILMIYGQSREDDIYKILLRQNIHHHLRNGMGLDLPVLINHHIDLLSHRDEPSYPVVRLKKALQISSHDFKYDHQHRDMIKHITSLGWAQSDIDSIQEICNECKSISLSREESRREEYSAGIRDSAWNMYWNSDRFPR